jgi:hypothetical protein
MKRILLLFLVCFSVGVSAQVITTFAGDGMVGYNGENIPATSSMMQYPSGIAFDNVGNVYFAERYNNRVRKVSPAGIISTVAGTGVAGFNGDNIAATLAQVSAPTGVTTDTLGNLYIADLTNNRVRKVNVKTGIITTVAGNGVSASAGDGGPATNAELASPINVYFNNFSGNLFVVGESDKIRKVNSAGIISTVAGTGLYGYSGDGSLATNAQIGASAVTTDGQDNLYIADESARIRRVDAKTNIITTFAGTGTAMYNGDAISCLKANIGAFDLRFDNFGNLFIADYPNNSIRKIDVNGIVTTIAGTGVAGYSGDNGPAIAAELFGPEGVGLDSCGNIYIADCQNLRIRKITYPKCGYLGVENEDLPNGKISIYPNPTYDILNINNLKTPCTYHLQNIVGTTIQQGTLKAGNNSISIQSIPNGMYMLELMDEEGRREVRKIVKE